MQTLLLFETEVESNLDLPTHWVTIEICDRMSTCACFHSVEGKRLRFVYLCMINSHFKTPVSFLSMLFLVFLNFLTVVVLR